MKWSDRGESQDIEDRRDETGGGGFQFGTIKFPPRNPQRANAYAHLRIEMPAAVVTSRGVARNLRHDTQTGVTNVRHLGRQRR